MEKIRFVATSTAPREPTASAHARGGAIGGAAGSRGGVVGGGGDDGERDRGVLDTGVSQLSPDELGQGIVR